MPAPGTPVCAPSPAHRGSGGVSRAEPCQASIPALSCPPPQGSLNMNRPFNLLRRLEGLTAGLLAGTHGPAMGTMLPCSPQGLPPTVPTLGTPNTTLLPGRRDHGCTPGVHPPHGPVLGCSTATA